MHDCGNLFLVGLMGSGKTTVGRQLARRLGRKFLDSDREVETRCGVPIPVIFEIEGEEGFRRREVMVIDALTQESGIVLATGGGAVLDAASRAHLQARGVTIYLRATPDDCWARTRGANHRPLLSPGDGPERLTDILAARESHYLEVAHLIVDTGKARSTRVVATILSELRARPNWAHLAGTQIEGPA